MKEKVIRNTIKIRIYNITVSFNFYALRYDYSLNGAKKKKGAFSSSYEGYSISGWKEVLIKGEALRLVLEQIEL